MSDYWVIKRDDGAYWSGKYWTYEKLERMRWTRLRVLRSLVTAEDRECGDRIVRVVRKKAPVKK